MAQVSIVMGSDSDMPVMQKAHIVCPTHFSSMQRRRRTEA